jgi:tRNA pseudouridine32 synthase/23S rRNA pseudouridine746 synthase
MRDGLAASFLQLPPGHWPSLLDFLCQRFAHVAAESWRARLGAGQVFDAQGRPYPPDSPYPAHQRIWYYREVASEPVLPFDAPVLYRDERLLVADKPHFLACVPGGRHVHQTLLTRLRQSLGLAELTPLHRLDRETAGVMLFCLDPACRDGYQQLFRQQAVRKEYQAIAAYRPELRLPLCYRSRLQERPDDFQMMEVAGEPNSATLIELEETRGALARYALKPQTGKKHQLRAHLAALGIAIHGDRWYPQVLPPLAPDDFSNPLRLLARAIEFTDPFDASQRRYQSARTLDWPAQPDLPTISSL